MKIGIVLSGGMAKGAYQAGALRAIGEYINLEDITCVSATSVGTLNAYAFLNERLDILDDLWRDICQDGTRRFVGQISRSSVVQTCIRHICRPEDRMNTDFYTTLWDLKNFSLYYKNLNCINSALMPLYLKASVAIPVYNKAVPLNGHEYFDGGAIDNIPVFPLIRRDLDFIICIHFDESCYVFENSDFDSKILKIVFPSKNFVRQTAFFDKKNIDEMLKVGYSHTKDVLDIVFAYGNDNCERIYKAISLLNKKENERSLRITSEIMMSNINRLTQKLMKRKVIV